MKARRLVTTWAVCATALASGTAGAAMMHPELGAHLAGMGEKGVVNLTVNTSTRKLCWSFDVHDKRLTDASIPDGGGMSVAALGSTYSAKGCTAASTMALDELESKPASYRVWVDTKDTRAILRGTLFAGMASMAHM